MIQTLKPVALPDLAGRMDTLIAEHGAWTVLKAALRAMLRRKPRPAPVAEQVLPRHLKRDIGLPPAPPAPARPHYLP